MRVCGVEIKASEACLAIVDLEDGGPVFIACKTKRVKLGDDKDAESVKTCLQTLKNFAHENKIEVFALKARNHGGRMGGGAVSFKMETLLQLTGTTVSFVNAVALSKFANGNLGGVPTDVLAYQRDAYLCAVYCQHKAGCIS